MEKISYKEMNEFIDGLSDTIEQKNELAVEYASKKLINLQDTLERLILDRRAECDALLKLYRLLKKNNLNCNGDELTKYSGKEDKEKRFEFLARDVDIFGFIVPADDLTVCADDCEIYMGITLTYTIKPDNKGIYSVIYDSKDRDYKYIRDGNEVIATASKLCDDEDDMMEKIKERDRMEFCRMVENIARLTNVFERQLNQFTSRYFEHAQKELDRTQEQVQRYKDIISAM